LGFVPILTYGHESWVMAERLLSQVQWAEMAFLLSSRRDAHNKVRYCEIRKALLRHFSE